MEQRDQLKKQAEERERRAQAAREAYERDLKNKADSPAKTGTSGAHIPQTTTAPQPESPPKKQTVEVNLDPNINIDTELDQIASDLQAKLDKITIDLQAKLDKIQLTPTPQPQITTGPDAKVNETIDEVEKAIEDVNPMTAKLAGSKFRKTRDCGYCGWYYAIRILSAVGIY